MNYNNLIDQLSETSGLTRSKTKELLEDAISVLSAQLSDGKGVSVPELGTFSTKEKGVRKVYNPHHEAYLMVPPKRVVEFSPSAGLKETLKFTETADE